MNENIKIIYTLFLVDKNRIIAELIKDDKAFGQYVRFCLNMPGTKYLDAKTIAKSMTRQLKPIKA